MIELTPQNRTFIRKHVGLNKNTTIPVKIILEGDFQPFVVGQYGGWYTKGGRQIHYPSAYSQKGWSNMVYRCQTRTILVGDKWIEDNIKDHKDKV